MFLFINQNFFHNQGFLNLYIKITIKIFPIKNYFRIFQLNSILILKLINLPILIFKFSSKGIYISFQTKLYGSLSDLLL